MIIFLLSFLVTAVRQYIHDYKKIKYIPLSVIELFLPFVNTVGNNRKLAENREGLDNKIICLDDTVQTQYLSSTLVKGLQMLKL